MSKSSTANAADTAQGEGELFSLLSAQDFIDREEPDWLIDEVLPNTGLASVYGPSGVGKTLRLS